jgi:hypothetical protein
MPTKTVATRLPEHLLRRLEMVAQIDRRSVAQVMALLIERGLPAWEEEIEGRSLMDREPRPEPTTTKKTRKSTSSSG